MDTPAGDAPFNVMIRILCLRFGLVKKRALPRNDASRREQYLIRS